MTQPERLACARGPRPRDPRPRHGAASAPPGHHGPSVPRKHAQRCAFDPLETSILKNDSNVVQPSKPCYLQNELVTSDSRWGRNRVLKSGRECGPSPPPSGLLHTWFRWMLKWVCLFQHVSDPWGWLSGSWQGPPCRATLSSSPRLARRRPDSHCVHLVPFQLCRDRPSREAPRQEASGPLSGLVPCPPCSGPPAARVPPDVVRSR